jgi:Cu(I)/Ag(I) efflux system membrane fusion protein
MKTKNLILALAAAGLLGAASYGFYRVGMSQGMQMAVPASGEMSTSGGASGKSDASAAGKKPLYWHDPMVPGQKFDKPGKSPFMDMQLVPVYANGDGDEGKVTISPRVQQNLGVRTAEVTKGALATAVEAVGSVAYNERDVAVVQARSNGFVEKLYVRAPLDPVKKGQALAALYVPEWVAAQEEYLSAKRITARSDTKGLEVLLDGARQRMRLVGITEDQIRLVESTGEVHARLTVTAPLGGVVAELGAREGMTVMAGAPLFRINGLSTVWVNAEVPETQAGWLKPESAVEARAAAYPGQKFAGKIGALLPEVNLATRTIKARIELANPQERLKPGMFVTVDFAPRSKEEVLLVPTQAVIQTGKRSVVIVADGDGKFAPVDVDVGTESGGQTEIRTGLKAGQKIVVSGQFLIDSEASLKATVTRMSEAPAPEGGAAAGQTHRGEGKVESIGKDEITLSHGPISSLQWGAMTMGFKLPADGLPKNIAVGDTVTFEIRQTKDGTFEIITISPTAAAPAQPMKGETKGEMKGDMKGEMKGEMKGMNK